MSFNITQPTLDLEPSFSISGGDGAEYQENKELSEEVSEAVQDDMKDKSDTEQLPLEPQIYPLKVTKESKRTRRQGDCIKISYHFFC